MWLLSTDRAELRFFISPDSVPEPGYASLSHVWDAEEQSFQDLQALRAECAVSGQNPRDLVSEKIRRCCELAQAQGYAWLWADTCCIDKSSSAELSEAINSMFRYYSIADVCYVYLRDVPTEGAFIGDLTGSSPFRDSRWHRRGWTLQELLAPSVVFFLSASWESLGSKVDLAEQLEEATGIPQSVLRLQTKLANISVAQRMSWAAFRQTTRPEDEAYCLMGIFDVNMPTLYGEGRRAFQRLQEEIMKRNTDTTLFAWGRRFDFDQLQQSSEPVTSSLFSTSPFPFRACAGLVFQERSAGSKPVSQKWHTKNGTSQLIFYLRQPMQRPRKTGGGPVSFSITPHGVLAHVPVADYRVWTFADLGWSENGQRVMLALARRRRGVSDLSYPIYNICGEYRLVRIPTSKHKGCSLLRAPSMRTTWKNIYLSHRPAHSPAQSSLPAIPINHCVAAPFRFPERRIANFARLANGSLESIQNAGLPWEGDPPTTFTFRISNVNFLVITVGRCAVPPTPTVFNDRPPAPMWANLQWNPAEDTTLTNMAAHDCATDHVMKWQELKKTFVLLPENTARKGYKFFTLSFTRCPLSSSGTLILDVSVEERFSTRCPCQSNTYSSYSSSSSTLASVCSSCWGDVHELSSNLPRGDILPGLGKPEEHAADVSRPVPTSPPVSPSSIVSFKRIMRAIGHCSRT
ncbi:HET-domain-containing protein [Polyporus arcularius HHB13444]|uniref:HET-domain-containing protein n=1 Tax=Polyporus arcularius HHB13444 TaxID=1314778 RepID=A0A5C3Q279_9APHY|nr:HET-domain-containing protein [Polyporus arcularius HHB13444]